MTVRGAALHIPSLETSQIVATVSGVKAIDAVTPAYIYTDSARTQLATVYADAGLVTPLTQPLAPSASGQVAGFVAPNQTYYYRAGGLVGEFDTVQSTAVDSSGAFAAPLRDAGGQRYNVEAYRQSGDNDDAAIARAYAAIPSSGGRLFLPRPLYTIGTGLDLRSGITTCGVPGVTVLKAANASNLNYLIRYQGLSAVAVEDLILNGNGTNQSGGSGRGIYFNSCVGAVARNVAGINFTRNGMIQTAASSNVRYERLTFTGNAVVVNFTPLFATNCTDIVVDRCTVNNSAWEGILIGTCSGVRIAHNYINACANIAIDVGGSSDVVVEGNVGQNLGTGGIWTEANSGSSVSNLVVEGNVMHGLSATGQGFDLGTTSTDTLTGVKVANNVFDGFQHGIYIARDVLDLTIAQNSIHDCQHYGIAVLDGAIGKVADFLRIDGNHVRNCSLAGSGSNPGIRVSGAIRAILRGNNVRGANHAQGIFTSDGSFSGNALDAWVDGNDLRGNIAAFVDNSGRALVGTNRTA